MLKKDCVWWNLRFCTIVNSLMKFKKNLLVVESLSLICRGVKFAISIGSYSRLGEIVLF